MKLLIICGSLERGKDGVGDYSRVLSEELKRCGITVYLLSFNDAFIQKPLKEGNVLRIPASFSYLRKRKVVRDFLKQCQPQLISLQYVPYSFSSKGIPFLFAVLAGYMLRSYKCHLFVHEVCVDNKGLKNKFLRYLQLLCFKVLVFLVRPFRITTSNLYYKQVLSKINITSDVLPIFSNIRNFKKSSDLQKKYALSEETKIIVFFGGISAEWEPQEFIALLSRLKMRFFVISVGNQGKGAFHWQTMVDNNPFKHISFHKEGFVSEEKASEILSSADLGVSTKPVGLLTKSGVVAACLNHGIPVLYTRQDIKVTEDKVPPFCYSMEELEKEGIEKVKAKSKRVDLLQETKKYYKKLFWS